MQTRVLKIGGATLFAPHEEFSRLVTHLRVEHLSGAYRSFCIVGGGDTVESMRTLQSHYPNLDAPTMHWRCVRLLDATWEVASELIEFCTPIETADALQHALSDPSPKSYLVNVNAYYTPADVSCKSAAAGHGKVLIPQESWNTTTDALAWWLAYRIGAEQVVIVKKMNCESIENLAQAAQDGVVDSEIARLHRAAIELSWADSLLPTISFLFEKQGWKYHTITQ